MTDCAEPAPSTPRPPRANSTKQATEDSTGAPVPLLDLRPAHERDYAYTESLYVQTMKPLLSRLDAWDEADVLAKFRSEYRPDEIRIITVGGGDVGFLHVEKKDGGISLAQIHIEAPYRSRGIGTMLIKDLLRDARAKSKPVSLSVVKHNPAQTLYERLGFKVAGEDETKLHMRWEARTRNI
jgi:ribosomal protein S18 acetylase RimI-like enzyme